MLNDIDGNEELDSAVARPEKLAVVDNLNVDWSETEAVVSGAALKENWLGVLVENLNPLPPVFDLVSSLALLAAEESAGFLSGNYLSESGIIFLLKTEFELKRYWPDATETNGIFCGGVQIDFLGDSILMA